MAIPDSLFWRSLRDEFAKLQGHRFSLIWNSVKLPDRHGNPPSHWSWWHFPNLSLRTQLGALALKGARGLGHSAEDDWYEELRKADFVAFKTMGSSRIKGVDGVLVDTEFGPIHDVVRESITLCHRQETAGTDLREILTWKEIAARFQAGAEQYPELRALWQGKQERWVLRGEPIADNEETFDPRPEELFKELAREAVIRAGTADLTGPLWQIWLDLLRKEKRGYSRIWQMRHWRGGRDLEAFQESGTIPSDAIWTDNGLIPHVFRESAEYCLDLGKREGAPKSAIMPVQIPDPNITSGQLELLRTLASNPKENPGAQFFWIRHNSSSSLVYSGVSIPITYDDSDFYQLRNENLITFVRLAPNQIRGKITQQGILLASIRTHAAMSSDRVSIDGHESVDQSTLEPKLSDWTQLDVRFLSDERVQIFFDASNATLNYAEFGFEDRRDGTPNAAWGMLLLLAKENGTVSRPYSKESWNSVEKRMQEIRGALREYFRLASNPIPFVKNVGYKTAFKISCAPAFDS